MEEISMNQAIITASNEVKSLLDKLFSKLADPKVVEDDTAKEIFPNGIGYISISVSITSDIGIDFTIADAKYAGPASTTNAGQA